jgi:hypothetical protein
MKKLGLFALVMGLIIAFAMPSLAFTIDGAKGQKMYIGGIFLTDTGYWTRSKEMTGTGEDQTQFFMTVPNHSRIRGSLQVGNVGGYWELGNGGSVLGATGSGAGTNNLIETRQLYGYYNFGNCQILAGKKDGYLFSLVPNQVLGVLNDYHVYGFGWGSTYDIRNPQIQFSQNISKQFGYKITLLNPAVYVDQTRTSYSSIPQIAAKVSLNFGMVSMFPAATYNTVKWDKMPSGYDDSLTSWYALLPVRVQAGAFVGQFQIGYGQNKASLLTLNSSFQQYQRVNGAIKNTTGIDGFIDLAYAVGAATPHIYFGYDNAKNSDAWKTGDDNNTRMMYGASVSYKVADGFYLVPELTFYDYGKIPNTAAKTDIGKEWLGGVQFQFIF